MAIHQALTVVISFKNAMEIITRLLIIFKSKSELLRMEKRKLSTDIETGQAKVVTTALVILQPRNN